MQRVVVIGSTGSGKSTFARTLAEKLNLTYFDLDDFHHLPGWKERPDEEFKKRVRDAADHERWVIAGNYSGRSSPITWPKADALIWLDMPFWPNLWKLLKRTLKRAATGEPICNGNKETFGIQFFTKNSILWWFLKTWHKNRKKYGAIFANPQDYPHLKMIRLRSYSESHNFIRYLSGSEKY